MISSHAGIFAVEASIVRCWASKCSHCGRCQARRPANHGLQSPRAVAMPTRSRTAPAARRKVWHAACAVRSGARWPFYRAATVGEILVEL